MSSRTLPRIRSTCFPTFRSGIVRVPADQVHRAHDGAERRAELMEAMDTNRDFEFVEPAFTFQGLAHVVFGLSQLPVRCSTRASRSESVAASSCSARFRRVTSVTNPITKLFAIHLEVVQAHFHGKLLPSFRRPRSSRLLPMARCWVFEIAVAGWACGVRRHRPRERAFQSGWPTSSSSLCTRRVRPVAGSAGGSGLCVHDHEAFPPVWNMMPQTLAWSCFERW